jgi:gliding motility-associated-like protein
MVYLSKNNTSLLILFIILFFHRNIIQSQCTGTDGTVTICDKELDPNYQTFDLFDHLNGVPNTGGTWSAQNPVIKNNLSPDTGIVNLWAINQFGAHVFTYSHPNCTETSNVTVFLGGYPGEDNTTGGANTCSSNPAVDLFNFLDNNLTSLNADLNGTWSADIGTSAEFLNDNFFNASAAGPGTYTFVYTVAAVDICPEKSAKVTLEVHRTPRSGEALDITICASEDLSIYTNMNLFDHLVGEDSNGVWTEINGTGQITTLDDSTINIEEIFNNFGPGDYRFEYTVFPTHGTCSKETTSVLVKVANITSNFVTANLCAEEPLTFEIQYQNSNGVSINYDLEYEIIDSNNSIAFSNKITGIQIGDPTIISPNITLPPGRFIIRTKEITNMQGDICSEFNVSEGTFVVFDTQIEIPNICYDTDLIDATIINMIGFNGNPVNGVQLVNYTITDLTTNQESVVTNQSINFINGTAVFAIDMSRFPKNHNDYDIAFTSTPMEGAHCLNQDFMVRRKPDDISLAVVIDNSCIPSDIEININAPTLSNGNYTISYNVTSVTTNQVLTSFEFDSPGSNSNFNISLEDFDADIYEVVLRSTQNDATLCREQTIFEVRETFSIGAIPETPVLDSNQSFCLLDYAPNLPTLSDIQVTQGTNITWYENQTSTTPLTLNTPLTDGETYYISSRNPNTNCESSDRSNVTVHFVTPIAIISNDTTPNFCAINSPSIANLEATANSGIVVWYDSPTEGNRLSSETLLTNETSYYAVENINGCEGSNRLEFTVVLLALDKPNYSGETELCAFDNLTLFDIESDFLDYFEGQLTWFDSPNNGNTIDSSNLIEENITYYAAHLQESSGCESERIPLNFSLKNCSEKDYDFFIPDGFSPNGDGINDNYYIPNIKYYYPNYTYEIFNRYGQSLFKGDINHPNWNGKNSASGNDVTSGVYFYILQYNQGDKRAKQGRIYLSK